MAEVVPGHLVLSDLREVSSATPDLIVEVAHPSVVAEYGVLFLKTADFMVCTPHTHTHTHEHSLTLTHTHSLTHPHQVGSPTALAEAEVEKRVVREAREGEHGLYIPAGAFWGGQDIQKMADRGTLKVRV